MYQTEKDFSKALNTRLSKLGMRVTRLESHGTGNGIPDTFIDGCGFDIFVELKNDKTLSIHHKNIKVQWRPGQQPWMYDYFIKHKHYRCCLTIIACADGWFVIPMTRIYKNDTVHNANKFSISYNDIQRVNVVRLLHFMSTHFSSCISYRTAIEAMVDRFWKTVDYDTEVLWDSNSVDDEFDRDVFESAKLDMFLTLENTLMNEG